MVSLNHYFAFTSITTQAASLFTTPTSIISRSTVIAANNKIMPLSEHDSSTSPLQSSTPNGEDDDMRALRENKKCFDDEKKNCSNDENTTTTTTTTTTTKTSMMDPIHFCFIIHGHQGRPTDLSYLHRAIKAKADVSGLFNDAKSSDTCLVDKTTKIMTNSAATGAAATAEEEVAVDRRGKRDRFTIARNKTNDLRDNHDTVTETGSTANENGNIDNDIEEGEQPTTKKKGSLVVHNIACNEGKTNDGIVKGGERLLDEMLDVIRSEVMLKQTTEQRQSRQTTGDGDEGYFAVDVTISMVGNSLGGLYGRYAVAQLAQVLDHHPIDPIDPNDASAESNGGYYSLDGRIRVHLNVFCSTASPHLGCAGHTFFPVPRTAEIGVAKVIGETGSDLFRLNDLLRAMATSPRYLQPLASFRKRIAYANAYRTDFPVPGATAAFLDKDSDYPHYFDGAENVPGLTWDDDATSDSEGIGKECPATEKGLIVATLHTPRLPLYENKHDSDKNANDLTAMSSSLDSLGWKKVFVDIRNEIPTMAISLPDPFSKSSCPIRELKSDNSRYNNDKNNNNKNDNKSTPVSSRDLERAISSSVSYQLPLGHNAICAFSRGRVSTSVNSGGRPVMDSLAIDLIREISLWNN